jgi:hypothetical protein
MDRQFEKQKDIKRNKLHAYPYETPKYKELKSRIKDEEDYYLQNQESA